MFSSDFQLLNKFYTKSHFKTHLTKLRCQNTQIVLERLHMSNELIPYLLPRQMACQQMEIMMAALHLVFLFFCLYVMVCVFIFQHHICVLSCWFAQLKGFCFAMIPSHRWIHSEILACLAFSESSVQADSQLTIVLFSLLLKLFFNVANLHLLWKYATR